MGALPQLGNLGMGPSFDQILAQLAAQHEPVPQPTAQHVRDSLPKVHVPPAGSATASATVEGADRSAAAAAVRAGDTCAVCHDEFEEGSQLLAIPGCMHCFHGDCIMPWLQQVFA